MSPVFSFYIRVVEEKVLTRQNLVPVSKKYPPLDFSLTFFVRRDSHQSGKANNK
jgi:hypothetical protein